LRYSEESSRRLLARRLATRRIAPKRRGQLHIFAMFTNGGWEHDHWPPALENLGHVTHFDWRQHGFDERAPDWSPERRQRLSELLFRTISQAYLEQPIDVFFAYLAGDIIEPWAVEAIGRMGIFTFNLGTDDLSVSFRGGRGLDEQPLGTAGLARAFDLNWTTGKAACEKYLVEGGIPLYLGQGGTPAFHRPLGLAKDIDVSFVGNAMGTRAGFVRDLRRRGVRVQAYGNGFPSGHVPSRAVIEIINRSRINLGHSGIGDSPDLLCLKARDFEVPLCGAFYLTRLTPDLADWYEIGREVAVYTSMDDLAEKVGYYLAHQEEAEAIAAAGYARASRHYTWERRFETVLRFAGALAAEAQPVPLYRPVMRRAA
jgi:hypothetical protein